MIVINGGGFHSFALLNRLNIGKTILICMVACIRGNFTCLLTSNDPLLKLKRPHKINKRLKVGVIQKLPIKTKLDLS